MCGCGEIDGENMARKYIHEAVDWPGFTWDSKTLAPLLSGVRLRQGLVLGKMRGYGFAAQWTATLKVLTEETIKSSAIEGVVLDPENVRSSLARRLGLEVAGLKVHKDSYVDGVVEMMLDATQKFKEPLTKERLFDWHADLFPGVRRTGDKFRVGAWRDDSQGPMQVVSGPILEERKGYYDVLEKTQAGSLDTTEWLTWFLGCLDRAIEQSSRISDSALEKELFWQDLKKRKVCLNDREKKVLNKLFSGFEGKLTREKWMKITKASSRTALRDIEELIAAGVIEQEEAGGRSTSYRLKRTATIRGQDQ